MVLRFTATVKKREVLVRDIDLPDGATVDVTIEPQAEEWDDDDLPESVWEQVRASERAYRRGEYIAGDELRAWLRSFAVHGGTQPAGTGEARNRSASVGAAPRRRKKPAARRGKRRG